MKRVPPEPTARVVRWQAGNVDLGIEEAGTGASVLLLPALSSISSRGEMRPLLDLLAQRFRTTSVDWPGFGDRAKPQADWTPTLLSSFLTWLLSQIPAPRALVAAGHAAAYAVHHACNDPGSISRLVLIAPTWRGPLPTMMGGQRPWFARIRAAIDNPIVGPLLYRLNVSRPVVGLMAREHVYSDPEWLSGMRLSQKLAVTSAVGARHASARFVTGALDRFANREAFVDDINRLTVPILVIYGAETPRKSLAEMEALAALPNVDSLVLPHGKLALHEEFPAEVAAAVLAFLSKQA
ncbi:MAG: alpha/beta hydrolase [Mesorhizobium sp.]|nr:alpha/beta hydrolase [Mesorhizobium sp.]